MTENDSKTLVDEKLAVSLFLDSLLRETEVEPELPAASVTDMKTTEDPPVIEVKQESITTDDVVDLAVSEESMHEEVASSEPAPIVASENETATARDTNEFIHPEWANAPFQVLLFNVAGLKIAVPLIELCAVIKWTDSVTEMPGHADFYMGILQHLEHKVAVIDTAKMIIPADKQEQLVEENPRKRVNHIVLIDNYRWGLACDKIGEVITLNPEDVRWRKPGSNRAWLAGTVIEQMCALLNSEGFALMLEKGRS